MLQEIRLDRMMPLDAKRINSFKSIYPFYRLIY